MLHQARTKYKGVKVEGKSLDVLVETSQDVVQRKKITRERDRGFFSGTGKTGQGAKAGKPEISNSDRRSRLMSKSFTVVQEAY
jgi:hypothetical protein